MVLRHCIVSISITASIMASIMAFIMAFTLVLIMVFIMLIKIMPGRILRGDGPDAGVFFSPWFEFSVPAGKNDDLGQVPGEGGAHRFDLLVTAWFGNDEHGSVPAADPPPAAGAFSPLVAGDCNHGDDRVGGAAGRPAAALQEPAQPLRHAFAQHGAVHPGAGP